MDGFKFDEFSKFLARGSSRRGILALIGASFALKGKRALGSQLGPATCGASGDACTLLIGCCDGLTCATSSINPSYGVCVPGDGGMVAVGTSLISPFSEGIVEDIGSTTTTDTTATSTATTQEAERDARIAAKKSRRNTRQTKVQSRRNEDQDKRDEQQENKRIAAGPAVELELFNKGGVGGAETLVVTNRDNGSITLAKIESILDPSINSSPNRSVGRGSTFNFYSDQALFQEDISDADELAWLNGEMCDNTPGAGFRLFIGFSSTSVNREYEVLCDGPSVITPPVTQKKKRKKQQQNRARAKSRQQAKNRNQKNGNR